MSLLRKEITKDSWETLEKQSDILEDEAIKRSAIKSNRQSLAISEAVLSMRDILSDMESRLRELEAARIP